MKHHKTLQYKDMLAKVMENISLFEVDPIMSKAKHEILISREYVARDADDTQLFHYLLSKHLLTYLLTTVVVIVLADVEIYM